MKPEIILQSDLLDLIFYNRNKAYGAYDLRKYYNGRLTKAVMLMSISVLTFSISLLMYTTRSSNQHSIVAGQLIKDVFIEPYEELPKKIEKIKPVMRQKQVAQIQNTTIKIVSDDLVDKPTPTKDDLTDKQIGLIDKVGDAVAAGDIPPPSEGVAGGTAIIGPVKPIAEEVVKPLRIADVMPEFPGGREAFLRFMLKNLREPDDLNEGEKIVVIVQFVVAADGTISDALIMQSGGIYDAEVLRVIKKMPRWKAGIKDGKSVPVYFRLPVTFQNSN